MRNSLIILLCHLGFYVTAQHTHSVKYMGITIHPFGDDYAYLQPVKLNKDAHVVLNFGALYEYEKYIRTNELSVKASTALILDCSLGWASANMLAIKAYFLKKTKHRLGLSFGPFYYLRESWERFDTYDNTSKFKEHDSKILGQTQSIFFWYGATVDYDYKLNEKWDFSMTFAPGIPYVMLLSVGVKYWPERKFNKLKFEY